jgi:hypothetical protein
LKGKARLHRTRFGNKKENLWEKKFPNCKVSCGLIKKKEFRTTTYGRHRTNYRSTWIIGGSSLQNKPDVKIAQVIGCVVDGSSCVLVAAEATDQT